MGRKLEIVVVQRRPNTCVTVVAEDGKQYVGFSKVCYPDTWSEKMGVSLALGLAVAAMWKIKPPKDGMIEAHTVRDPRLDAQEDDALELPAPPPELVDYIKNQL